MSSIKPVFPRHEQWQVAHFATQPFQDLLSAFHSSLVDTASWPRVSDYAKYLTLHELTENPFRFLAQRADGSLLSNDSTNSKCAEVAPRYYEQIIFEDKCIPTRACNWHDFYNACIWRLFPQTKRQLNTLHMQDIADYGVSPRTSRRDRITHFDECGVVLAYSDGEIPELLAQHQWQDAFHTHRQQWGKTVRAYVFGHANYEMLMRPHIGLTGKWLGIKVADAFWQSSLSQQYGYLDGAVSEYAATEQSFRVKPHFKPLPLLGVPGWWAANQQVDFYHNRHYFRPKRSNSPSDIKASSTR